LCVFAGQSSQQAVQELQDPHDGRQRDSSPELVAQPNQTIRKNNSAYSETKLSFCGHPGIKKTNFLTEKLCVAKAFDFSAY
jgi:hypothetical protein